MVVGAYPIDAHDDGLLILVQHRSQERGGAISAGPGGEGELEGSCGPGQVVSMLLRDGPGDYAPEDVPGSDASNPAVFLAQGGDTVVLLRAVKEMRVEIEEVADSYGGI